jgi:hypothetical protein
MAEAEPLRMVQISLPPSDSPPPAVAANACIVNKLGQTVILDFGFADPLATVASPEGISIRAIHVARTVIAEDIAIRLRDDLNRVLGNPS